MTLFWILAGGMTLLAWVFLLPLISKQTKPDHISTEQLNIDVIKQQLAELETDLNNGKLNSDDYAAARKDLEKELLYDLTGTSHASGETSERRGRWAIVVLIFTIPATSIMLYQQIGTNRLFSTSPAEKGLAAGEHPSQGGQAPSLEEMIAMLAIKLEEQPNNPKGWYMLARSYMALNRYSEAVQAYQRLHELTGDQPEILVSYADALAMVHNGKLAGKPLELINRALALNPAQPQGLWLAGMAASQQGDYASAVAHWHQLAPLLKDDPDSLTEINQLIAQAEQRGNLPHEPPTTASTPPTTKAEAFLADTPSPTAQKALTVNITLDPALNQQTSPDDILFVFAQATEGPPMPLAVVRKQVKDLPLKVTLDDSMAMAPGMRLSNYSQVKVGARVSKSGNAMLQSGDFYGEVNPVAVAQGETVQITINHKMP
jgi:cytochrome c-type biogenesis protein CcmH